jgi:acetoin utilization protein AcuA
MEVLYFANGEELFPNFSFHPELNSFRTAKEQENILMRLIQANEISLSIAVEDSQVIGYAVLLLPDSMDRWSKLPFVTLLGALEVAKSYRNKRVAFTVLEHLFSNYKSLEEEIIIALEYYWHWDIGSDKQEVLTYKNGLKRLLGSFDMEVVYTDDPDIQSHWANFMMARIGKKITSEQLQKFLFLANPKFI